MSKNNGTGFWVIVGLVLVLIPVTLVVMAIAGISRVTFGRRRSAQAR